jgi:hypothetical protein
MIPGRSSLVIAANVARVLLHELSLEAHRAASQQARRPARMLVYSLGGAPEKRKSRAG